jgi:hypothetical protein
MAQQMEAYMPNYGLFSIFQSGFGRHHTTTVVVLKVHIIVPGWRCKSRYSVEICSWPISVFFID